MKKIMHWRNVAHAAKIVSRRFPQIPFANVCYETDAPPVKDPPPDKRTEKDLLTAIDGLINKALETRATKEELAAIKLAHEEELKGVDIVQLRAMADDKTGVMAMLAKQGLEMKRMETKMANAVPMDMSLRGQVARWQEKNKDQLLKVMAGASKDIPDLDIQLRVASPMTPATVNATSSPYIGRTEVEPGVNDFLRIQPTFWDFLTKGRTNATTYVWVNKTNPLGAAAFIGPGVPKPGVSFELIADNSVAKKIADSAKAATELLQDIDGMTTFIEQELRYQVMIKINSTLMAASAGSTTVPAGIRNYATTYTETGIHVNSGVASMADAIRAVVGQLRSGFLTGPITVFINSIDSANMDIAKATDSGVYLLPPFVTSSGRTIAGATIIEDNNIAVGSFLAGFLRYYRILIYKDFTISWGWENDDFTRNLVTAIGEMRLHQFVNNIYSGFVVYDTFQNVIDAIAPVP